MDAGRVLVRTVHGEPPIGRWPIRGNECGEGARPDAMVSRTTRASRSGSLRQGRTRGVGKRDMGPQSLGEHRSDAPDLLQRVERTERSARRAILHDPRREGGADAGQSIEVLEGGDIDVDRTCHDGFARARGALRGASRPARAAFVRARSRRPGGRRRRPRGSSPRTAGRDGRIHPGELGRERRPGVGISRAGSQRATTPDPDAERGDRSHEEQGLAFPGRGHRPTLPAERPSAAPPDCLSNEKRSRARTEANRTVGAPESPVTGALMRSYCPYSGVISRRTARATSPTSCSVTRETLSGVSSVVWCQA